MRFQCPHCQSIVSIPDTECGQPVGCGKCGGVSIVPESPFSPSVVIDDFVIKKIIGKGGMGVVYLAHQLSLDRPVALKILMTEFSQDRDFVVDFVKEARAAARLNHLNIVQSYAVGEEGGIYFFAMEYVEGNTLKKIMKANGKVPIETAIQIMRQIAEALDFAWKNQQLVHRDIKPDNIMITNKNVAKLADLGLARKAAELADMAEEDEVMGTPQYISPEQLLGKPMDVRGDLYSLGATFFHAVTGRFPFEGNSAGEIARKHLEAKLEPAHKVNPEVPPGVSKIISRMMAKHLEDRYADAAEFVAALDAVSRELKNPEAASASPEKKKSKTRSGGKATRPAAKRKPGTKRSKAEETPPPAEDEEAEEAAVATPDQPATPSAKPKKSGRRLSRRKSGTRTSIPEGETKVMQEPVPVAKAKQGGGGSGSKVVLGLAGLVAVAAIAAGVYFVALAPKGPTSEGEFMAMFAVNHAKELQDFRELEPFLDIIPGNLDEAQEFYGKFNGFANQYQKGLFVRPASELEFHLLLALPEKFGNQARNFGKKYAGVVLKARDRAEEYEVRYLRGAYKEKEASDMNFRLFELALAAAKVEELEAMSERITTTQERIEEVLHTAEASNEELPDMLAAEKILVMRRVVSHCATADYLRGIDLLRDMQAEEKERGYPARTSRQVSRVESLIRTAERFPQDAEKQFSRSMLSLISKFELGDTFEKADSIREFEEAADELLAAAGLDGLGETIRSVEEQEQEFYTQREDWFNTFGESVGWARDYYSLVAGTGDKLKGQRVAFSDIKSEKLHTVKLLTVSSNHLIIDLQEYSEQLNDYHSAKTFKKSIAQLPWAKFQELAVISHGTLDAELQRNLGAHALMTGKFGDVRENLEASGDADFLLEHFDDLYLAYGCAKLEEPEANKQRVCALLNAKCSSMDDCGEWSAVIDELCQ